MATQSKVIQLTDEEEQEHIGLSLWQLALRRLRRDRLTLVAMAVLALFTLMSIFAPTLEQIIGGEWLASRTPDFRLFANTMLPDVFLPPGGAKRLVYIPDYRLGPRALNSIVLLSRRTEYTQLILETPRSFFNQHEGQAGVRFVQGSEQFQTLNLFVDDATTPIASRIRAVNASDLQALAPGTYTFTVREQGAEADADPVAVLEDVTIAEGQIATIVLMGDARRTDERGLALNAFVVNGADIPAEQTRVQVIIAAPTAPERTNFLLQNELIVEAMTYGQETVIDRGVSRSHVGFSDVNAYRHILGTDDLGRDQLVRLMYAGQVSLGIGFLAASISIFIGVVLGILTGFYGGVIDDLINWLITTISSIPTLLLLLIIVAVLSPGPFTLILVLGFLGWLGTCRLVRGETFSIRAREYIISARAIGAPVRRIMMMHILPNLLSVVIIAMALDIGNLILVESGLSFLGFGIKPPTPSWGNMLTNAQDFFRRGAHLLIPPGVMISITVLCLYIIGDGLRDAFDPTLRN